MTLEELKEFCIKENLVYQSMRRLTLNVVKKHQKYYRMVNSEIKTTRKIHKFLDNNGNLVVVDNLPKFCRETGMNYSMLRSVSNGTKKKTKEGYTKYTENVNNIILL
jgi:hypothetical protein